MDFIYSVMDDLCLVMYMFINIMYKYFSVMDFIYPIMDDLCPVVMDDLYIIHLFVHIIGYY